MSNAPPLHLGISPLSWVNEVLDDLGKGTSADLCLSEAAAAGYAGVELSKIFPKDNPATLKALLDGHGLSLATGWYNKGCGPPRRITRWLWLRGIGVWRMRAHGGKCAGYRHVRAFAT